MTVYFLLKMIKLSVNDCIVCQAVWNVFSPPCVSIFLSFQCWDLKASNCTDAWSVTKQQKAQTLLMVALDQLTSSLGVPLKYARNTRVVSLL